MTSPVPPSPPRIELLLEAAVTEHPSRPALVHGGRELDYANLGRAVGRLAAELERAVQGVELRGARIAIISGNSPALAIGAFAAWRLGGVAVPLNARLREYELRQALGDAQPVLVISISSHLGYAFTRLLPALLEEVPSVRACLFVDAEGVVAETVSGRADPAPAPLDAEIAAVLYTSGTTGSAKGALVAHARELEASRHFASALSLAAPDGVGIVVPFSHAFGLTCLLATVAAGARGVLVESTLTVGPLLEALERDRSSVLHGSPSLFTALLKARPGGVPGIRTGFVAGAPSPPGLIERLEALGMGTLNLYGLTEIGAVACCRPEDPPDRRRATAGRPLPGTEVRVQDGELQVRPPYAVGYVADPDQASAFMDGWFPTGDAAVLEDGYVRISGRLKDLVHIGGFNVFPAEVEAVLTSHPDVIEAAVVGAEDEHMGEVLRAYVVARPGSGLTTGALLGFARGQIAGYKLPYAIRFLPELPLLPSGKPDRRALSA